MWFWSADTLFWKLSNGHNPCLPAWWFCITQLSEHLLKAHCGIWLASLKNSEKHKTTAKYQQAMPSSRHEKMGFEIQVRDIITELKQQRFWVTHVNQKWTFCTFEPWFWTNFGKIVSIRITTLGNIYMVASRLIKREKAHFRLTGIAQKRRCLSSLLSPPHPCEQKWKFNSRWPHYFKRIIYFKNDWRGKN